MVYYCLALDSIMSKAERTRRFIIEQTAPLFNKRGIAGTSLNDMIEATGLTKGSIYGNFENKDEVVKEVFRYNVSTLRIRMEALIQQQKDPRAQLMAVLEFYRSHGKNLVNNGGCPLLNTAAECDDSNPVMLKEVQNSFKTLLDRITRIIQEGQQEGCFNSNADSVEYSRTIVLLVEGGILLTKTFRSQQYLELALDRAEHIIKEELGN